MGVHHIVYTDLASGQKNAGSDSHLAIVYHYNNYNYNRYKLLYFEVLLLCGQLFLAKV